MARTVRVLLLAASSERGTDSLRVDREIRGAVEAARRGGGAGRVRIAAELAVRRDDLLPALLCHDPHVVHFAAHGRGGEALLLDDGTEVSTAELVALLPSARRLRMVVLAACGTLPIARALSAVADYVVAMELPIRDEAAIHFTGVLYALLASGRAIPEAFELARDSASASFGAGCGAPHLLARPGAGRRPLVEPRVAGAGPRPIAHEEVNDVEGIEAGEDVEVTNDDRGRSRSRRKKINHVRNVRADGSVRIGNTS
jgi:hypothetical protein